jgi:hypothetical protein
MTGAAGSQKDGRSVAAQDGCDTSFITPGGYAACGFQL